MNTTTGINESSSALDGYAAYRVSGELFGRLREALGFGELAMCARTWGQSGPPKSVAFQWTFKASDKRYCCEENVPMVELMYLKSVESFARYLSNKWKNEHRRTAGPKTEAV